MRLKDYIERNNLQVTKFAKCVGASHATIINVVNGGEPRLSLALRIEEKTIGLVTCEDLVGHSAKAEKK